MSSWLAALGPCASPKSKAKERKEDGASERPVNLSSLKRRGSLTEIRNSRKVTASRSFRERLQDTFEGSLRRAKKAGSLEAVDRTAVSHTFANPDTNMNLATSLSPKSSRSYSKSPGVPFTDQESQTTVQDKFWTNFYNTLPRNRHKSDRPKDLSLQDLPVTEREAITEEMISQSVDVQVESKPNTEIKWQGYATSPRTKRKAKTLERMNSAPSSRKSPVVIAYEGEPRAGSDGQASPQIIDSPDQVFDIQGQEFVIMPRSVSLQDDYWMPATKGGSKIELRRVTPSPDRLMVRHSPSGGSPVHLQGGHVWVKSKDGTHVELHSLDRLPRDLPSPSESQNTESSGFSYTTAASSVSNLETVPKFPVEDKLPTVKASVSTQVTSEQGYMGPYMSPEEYQANIFDLIQSLNQSPPNPSSPEFKRSRELRPQMSQTKSPIEDNRVFHSEKFIVLGNSSPTMKDGDEPEKR